MPALRNPASRVAALVAVLLLAGCRGDDGDADSVTTPTELEECNHGPVPHADDLFIPLAMHWNDGDHTYDEGAPLFVCVSAAHGGEVSVHAPGGVAVSPPTRTIDPSGSGVLRFTVRATPGASGQIEASWDSEDIGGTQTGPEIDTDDDHWSFQEPH